MQLFGSVDWWWDWFEVRWDVRRTKLLMIRSGQIPRLSTQLLWNRGILRLVGMEAQYYLYSPHSECVLIRYTANIGNMLSIFSWSCQVGSKECLNFAGMASVCSARQLHSKPREAKAESKTFSVNPIITLRVSASDRLACPLIDKCMYWQSTSLGNWIVFQQA